MWRVGRASGSYRVGSHRTVGVTSDAIAPGVVARRLLVVGSFFLDGGSVRAYIAARGFTANHP